MKIDFRGGDFFEIKKDPHQKKCRVSIRACNDDKTYLLSALINVEQIDKVIAELASIRMQINEE